MVIDRAAGWRERKRSKRLDGAMLMPMKKLVQHICTPDELDMIEHYRTPAEKTADLVVHVVGLTLAAVGGIVLAVLAALYSGIGAVVATAAYALCLIAMLTAS